MRRILSLLLAVLLVAAALPLGVITAGAEESINYSYEEYSDGTASLTGYSVPSGYDTPTELEIPAVTPNGSTVTAIANSAFKSYTAMEKIILPDTIKSIGASAFYGCWNLKEINMPSSLETIGNYAFYQCRITEISLPDSVTSIGMGAFANTEYQQNGSNYENGALYASNCLIRVKDFSGTLTIKEGTRLIADWAFDYCWSITEVVMPDSVTHIGSAAFNGMSALTDVTISAGLKNISSSAFGNCTSLKNVIIPDSVEAIDSHAFNNCNKMESVTIGSGVKTIEARAFNLCTALKTVYYTGTEAEWNSISVDSNNNTYFTDAQLTYLPKAPLLDVSRLKTVILQRVSGYEYSLGGEVWQDSNIFLNLLEDKVYSFYQRVKITDSNAVTLSSEPVNVILLSKPTVLVGYDCLRVKPTEGYEYMLEGGNWQDSNYFEVEHGGTYTVYHRPKNYSELEVGVNAGTTVTVNGENAVSSPTAEHLTDLKKLLLTDPDSNSLAADVNADGVIDILDFIKMKKQIAD